MPRGTIALTICWVLIAAGPRAQSSAPPPAGQADGARSAALYLKAKVLVRQGRHDTAREALVEAIRLADATNNPTFVGTLQHELGWVLFEIEGHEAAQRLFLQAIDSMVRAGDARGETKMRLSLIQVLEPSDARRRQLEEGLAAARRLGDQSLEAGYLQRLGEYQLGDGRYIEAIVSLRAAAAGYAAEHRTWDVVRAQQVLSRLYRKHGRADLAHDALAGAAHLLEESGQREAQPMVHSLRASAEFALGRTKQAIAYQLKAVALVEGTDSRRTLGLLNLELAWYYIYSGRAADATAICEHLVQAGDGFLSRIAWDPLSNAYLALGRYRDAINAADKALALAFERSGTPLMLATRARARRGAGDRQQALEDVREALVRIERTRATLVPTDSMKQSFAEMTQDLFDLAITLHAELDQPMEALTVAEQARSRAFLDLLASRRDRDALAALDSPETAAMPALGEIPSIEQAAPFSGSDYTALAARLQSTVLVYWVGAERSLMWVIPAHGTPSMKPIAATRARLQSLVAGTIPGASAGTRAPSTPMRNASLRAGPQAADAPLPTAVLDVATRRANWRTLHQLLIEPAKQDMPRAAGARLTIVPHGPLVQLSFAALRNARDEYLLERYAIHYVPAGAALASDDRSDAPATALIVGAPDRFPHVAGLRLTALPGAAAEARLVAKQYARGAARIVLGSAAGERAVRDAIASASDLHFATHAVTPSRTPLAGFLALRPGTNAPDDDGRLTLAEIYQLRLSARLAVLSACRSASGDGGADGIAGFARAFLSAGVRTVVGGLWELPDLTSATVMRDFHATRKSGHASALRRAQLRLLRALRAGEVTAGSGTRKAIVPEDPALWAGFIVLGEP